MRCYNDKLARDRSCRVPQRGGPSDYWLRWFRPSVGQTRTDWETRQPRTDCENNFGSNGKRV